MIEERLEDTGRQIAMSAARAGGGLALRVSEQTAGWFLRYAGRRLDALRGLIRRGRDTGRMSERRLQHVAGGDLHTIELRPSQIRKVTASLHKAGVRYAVERGEAVSWIHFEGRDLDHVTHAVRRALNEVGIELRVDNTQPKHTTPAAQQPESVTQSYSTQHQLNHAHSETATPAATAEQTQHQTDSPTVTAKTTIAQPSRKISRTETLTDLHDRISRKLNNKPQRASQTRNPDRSHSR